MSSIKKRFIAGASCPNCATLDSLRWWIENNIEWVECVDCEFTEQRTPKAVEKTERSDEELIGIFRPE
ncbi:YheV family putative zinc ribbon protein [Vibrio hangzhouensis]|uniref:YheV family putative zinc ribbon protein n=1 Tax=Vibrio hangzhouensis TaxID=462991 RepID=UPI001C951236|nr:YheV family putative zinc ribbon protein [Vibrio hangzhouensis]MBY6198554.1 YheV family putative metal-binding protein [Vibrio hangzhouensis]